MSLVSPHTYQHYPPTGFTYLPSMTSKRTCMVLLLLLVFVSLTGYAISDTALASLISRYSLPESQGRNLGLSHACQSGARIISPLIAGTLYEKSKTYVSSLPVGALPYVVASFMPLLGMMIPTLLYLRSVEAKRALLEGAGKKDQSA